MSKLLEVKDLHVSFNTFAGEVQAVRGVNFELNEGETLAIVGESGSGKSVTSSAIMRLLPEPQGYIKSGQILYKGEDLGKKTEKEMEKIRGKEISMVFQDPMSSLNPTMKIGKQISEGLIKHQGLSKDEAWKKPLIFWIKWGFRNLKSEFINIRTNFPAECGKGSHPLHWLNPKILIADDRPLLWT